MRVVKFSVRAGLEHCVNGFIYPVGCPVRCLERKEAVFKAVELLGT